MTYTIEACGKLGDLLPQPLTLQTDAQTVATLLAEIGNRFPALQAEMLRTAVARGPTILDRTAELVEGDNLALIPPVGGG